MNGFIVHAIISGFIIASVAHVAPKFPRYGGLILSLPLISIGAFLLTWYQNKNISVIARLSFETLILVPLGLAFFVPLALSEKMGIGFWPAFVSGIALSAMFIGIWFWLGAQISK